MIRALPLLRWLLFGLYALSGAVALMIATPKGLELLGQPVESLSFIPARVLGLPWSLPLELVDEDPITTLAILGICYGLNFGVGLVLARGRD